MADAKLTALTAITSASLDDIVYVVDDPGGTPASKKITIADLLGATSNEFALAATTYLYFGPSGTDGTWRIGRSGNNLVIERRETGSYVEKGAFTA
jgi:hypothetical protein